MRLPALHELVDTVTATVTVASIVCNLLPKSTVFNDYPRVKKAYETSIAFVIALAFNFRQCMPSLGLHIPGLGFQKPETQNDVTNFKPNVNAEEKVDFK